MGRAATLLMLVWIFAMPLTALAQEAESTFFNPPDWFGWMMFSLALILPAIAYFWYRSQRM